MSIAEAVVDTVDSLGLVAGHVDAGRVGDILDDGLVELAPDTVGDQEAWEHRVDDCEVRVLIVKGGTIDGRAVHDVFNADSPASIIRLGLLLSKELKEAVESLVLVRAGVN